MFGDDVSTCAKATVIGGIKVENNVVSGVESVGTGATPNNCIVYRDIAALKKR